MITYNRPEYTEMSLQALLDSCDEHARVWVWHNGDHDATRRVGESLRDHPRLHRFHHSPANVGLNEPTNWLWSSSDGDLLSKVDDDCIVAPDWITTLRRAHVDNRQFGAIGSWRFYDEDFVPRLANRKITDFPGGHRIMRHPWVQGSGYLMKRACIDEMGPLRDGQSFTQWCIELARHGWINGWYFPFIHEEHLDDPRSPHTGLLTDADLQAHLPLSARNRGITTLSEWEDQMRRSAYRLQEGPVDPRAYTGLRRRLWAARHTLLETLRR